MRTEKHLLSPAEPAFVSPKPLDTGRPATHRIYIAVSAVIAWILLASSYRAYRPTCSHYTNLRETDIHSWSGAADPAPDASHQVLARQAAVACDVPICSTMATDILRRGGSAVDAAVTTALCIGSVNSHSSGIGGGGFMTVRHPNGSALAFDFRETAPGAAHKHMYDSFPLLARLGGLAVAIPGEVAGLEDAWKLYGKLSWAELIQPVIDLNRNGFQVSEVLEAAIQKAGKALWEFRSDWEFVFVDSADGPRLARRGDIIKRENLANTLEEISRFGAKAFYHANGTIAPALVDTIRRTGGIASLEDFARYNVIISEPLRSSFWGREVITTPNPTSGPALVLGLNVMNGFKRTAEASVNFGNTATQRLVETMKWIASARTELGDPMDVQNPRAHMILELSYADSVRANISDTHTLPWQAYNPSYEPNEPHGTAHFSIIDQNCMAVAMTTTVNLEFGSLVCDPVTGIVLNSEMDDFSLPNTGNSYDLRPSIYNYVQPYKRPLSSTVPTIISYNGVPELIIGAAGGSRIVTAVFQAIVRTYMYKLPLLETIAFPRIHHQLLPEVASVERGAPLSVMRGLEEKRHQAMYIDPKTSMNAIYRDQDSGVIYAVSDWWRKRGGSDGY
jgi:gamma-glutamyltranspeptidase